MSRRKGEITPRMIDRTHPQQVQIFVPGTGLGRSLDTMLAWCRERDWRRHPFSAGGRSYARFCFIDPADADAFSAKFGGERLHVKTP
ncbi:hypothetical protein [Bosea sp. BIWAKO-01]|uniref:hypothetical protein n=1 Tax=Bosea sp. BIWAKO-01 TaxID=506668 RepID=UPI000852F418|nr:hypothetical protein [Bosea sp. BIWAKO-01]GAU86696.1 hypothetical protein BIWAKO_06644 [Bosea sp. BIWAKO-01]